VGHHLGVMDPFSIEFDPFAGNEPPTLLTGWLLVATPRLVDPNFSRRVILILDHGAHGALGVVINHPGGVPVRELMEPWHGLAAPPAEIFTGGPVARNALVGLVRLTGPAGGQEPPGWRLLVEGDSPVGLVDLAGDVTELGGSVGQVRLFSGYAGWDAEQLEDEIDGGSWYVLKGEARDPLTADPEGLWGRVLRRQGGALALVAGFPPDLSAN